jgi:hypothetical protein
MSFWSKLNRRRKEVTEQRRSEAFLRATAAGATLEESRKAADRAARGNTSAAITGAING